MALDAPVRPQPGLGASAGRNLATKAVGVGDATLGVFDVFVAQLKFYLRILRALPRALRYPKEILVLMSDISLGSGALVVGGGMFFVVVSISFFTGTEVGLEGFNGLQQIGAEAFTGVITSLANTREITPLVAGVALAAQVGAGFTAQLGAMRISDEIDALEVMGLDSITFLCATRILAAWIVLPFMYISAIGIAYLASYLAVVQQVGYVSSGGYFLIFWQFQNPPDFLFSLIKAMTMATAIVLVGCYYGYNANGGPVGVGTATAKSMVLNLVLVNLIGMLGTVIFWGTNPRAPIGG
jgi:phospholipid/cholesterol/gamma-HCH transport system permease protein